jgi:hypothetical protein
LPFTAVRYLKSYVKCIFSKQFVNVIFVKILVYFKISSSMSLLLIFYDNSQSIHLPLELGTTFFTGVLGPSPTLVIAVTHHS